MLLNNIRKLIQISEMHIGHVLSGAGVGIGAGAGAGYIGNDTLRDIQLDREHVNTKLQHTIDIKDTQMDTAAKVAGGAAALGIATKLAKRKSRNDDA